MERELLLHRDLQNEESKDNLNKMDDGRNSVSPRFPN
jgi:hypothetical protein